MAQNGRAVNPNCPYASNPYHECTDACLRKISENPPPKNKKSSDYGRTVAQSELGKKINDEKQILSGCPKASNSYHQCDENCHKRISEADSGTIPLKLNWKKKPGSKPQRLVLDGDGDLASKVRAVYPSEKQKMEPKPDEHIPWEPVSSEEHIQDVKPMYHKDQAKDDDDKFSNNHTETSEEDEKNNSDEVDPSTYVNDTDEGFTTSAGKLLDFSFSGISMIDDHDNGEDTVSVVSEARVPIGKYSVRETFAPILRSIFQKYGDIGASCHLESVVMRSYYIECVCFIVQELHSSSIMQLTKCKVKELMAILKDVESAQLQVAWLHKILDEVAEHVELVNRQRDVEIAKANSENEVESLREELQSEMEILSQKEQEVDAIKARIDETRDRLRELELKSSELDKCMSLIKSKVDSLDGKSLIDELL